MSSHAHGEVVFAGHPCPHEGVQVDGFVVDPDRNGTYLHVQLPNVKSVTTLEIDGFVSARQAPEILQDLIERCPGAQRVAFSGLKKCGVTGVKRALAQPQLEEAVPEMQRVTPIGQLLTNGV